MSADPAPTPAQEFRWRVMKSFGRIALIATGVHFATFALFSFVDIAMHGFQLPDESSPWVGFLFLPLAIFPDSWLSALHFNRLISLAVPSILIGCMFAAVIVTVQTVRGTHFAEEQPS